MAKLLSELEKFEQEMKELGSDISSVTEGVGAAPPLNPSPLPPRLHPPTIISPPSIPQASPPRPVPSTPIGSTTPWLVNPGGMSSVPNVSTSSQFTYATSAPFPPSTTAASASYFPVPIHLQQQNSQYPPQPQQFSQFQPQVQPTVVKPPQYTYQTGYQAPFPTPNIFALPQQQQAQQLFQRDAQTITPEALENVKAALASGDNEHKTEAKKKAIPRKAAGQTWEDPTLSDWPENDYRLFCGDLGNEVNDEVLTKAFSKYTNFNMARVVRDKRTGKTKGYGFVSFSTPAELALAMKEMNGKYVGNRPIKLRKSTWKERTDAEALDKHKSNKRPRITKKNVLHK